MVVPPHTRRLSAGSLGPLTTILGSGGQGTVYAVPGTPPCAYKEYDAATAKIVDITALEAMARLLEEVSTADADALRARAAWPTALVERGGRTSGFIMAQVPPAFSVRMRFPRGYRQKLGQVQLLLNDARYLTDRELFVDDRIRLELLRDTAQTMEIFHRLGVVVGDLSPNNLCFSLSRRPRSFFIDCDAMPVRGRMVLPQLETDDWQVPTPGEQLGTRATDSYKFALLSIRLFAGDQTSRDPAVLLRVGPGIHDIVVRGLEGDARLRPSFLEWRTALDTALTGRHTTASRDSGPLPTAPIRPGPRLPRQPRQAMPGRRCGRGSSARPAATCAGDYFGPAPGPRCG